MKSAIAILSLAMFLTFPCRAAQTSATQQSAPSLERYTRGPEHAAKFNQAQKAGATADYKTSCRLLREIVASDLKDFEACLELGKMLVKLGKYAEAERAYQQTLQLRPTYMSAKLDLGKLQLVLKQYDAAVETMRQLVEMRPEYAESHYYLGEAYLRVKKGSRAIVHFNEAIRLDPMGMADAHLRLAALFVAAGLKNQAAAEYAQFLVKRPDYPEREKLQNYIRKNKKL
jgi:tetratricopeptide (TPR) repeat protein